MKKSLSKANEFPVYTYKGDFESATEIASAFPYKVYVSITPSGELGELVIKGGNGASTVTVEIGSVVVPNGAIAEVYQSEKDNLFLTKYDSPRAK